MKEILINVLHNILGPASIADTLSYFLFALIGVILNLLYHSTKRDPLSVRTPTNFSLKVLLIDNWQRIAMSAILIFTAIRFCEELTGFQISMKVAFGIGLGFDVLSQYLKKLGVLDNPNQKPDFTGNQNEEVNKTNNPAK